MPLTDKQKRFCDEYLIDLNATQAAIRAGYSKTTAEKKAQLFVGKSREDSLYPFAYDYVQARLKKISVKLEITQERVMQEYARIAFSDIRQFYKEDGSIKQVHELDDNTAASLAGVEVDELYSGSGGKRKKVGATAKIKLIDKKGALDSLCKMMGFNAPEKQDITTNGESLNKIDISKYTDDELRTLAELQRKGGISKA